MERRKFIKVVAGGSSILFLPLSIKATAKSDRQLLRFGICADIHKDIMCDADSRLKTFIDAASDKKTDFIIQMGDFCRPYDYNREFLSVWNSYPGEKHHVIGNHDTDGGFTREKVIEFWGSPASYYSFDTDGVHFIVLDGNDKNPSPSKAPGYARFIGDEQKEWLKNDLRATQLPCILFSHQSLENTDLGIENQSKIRQLLEDENKISGFKKVIACFSGHHHIDYATEINGIYYIQINSMSYFWLGDQYKTIRYSDEVDNKYPWIKYTAPYRDPLFAFVEIDSKSIRIEGRKSEFVGLTPKELDYPEGAVNNPVTAKIDNRRLKY
ncbi:MAG: metallophosphoesterase [Prolixibacteraceae bacterium]|nr:metallophosphoesterase [Prolixibacteraceae bacterium]